MADYVVEYQGTEYEFPTWKEMMEFIEEHETDSESDTE